jgi:flavin reductase (DIM6/NTAB) family NADH-FMN oxidoreductase RutF
MNDDQRQQMFAALGRIPSGLFVLTVRHGEQETGVLTSWVQQCSFEPPQLSVALKQGREIGAWLTDGATFVLNVLDDSQTDMVGHFGRGFALTEPAFDGLSLVRSPAGHPVLEEAHAFLECQVVSRCPTGDHDLLIARVIAGKRLGEGEPMVHIRKRGSHY